MQKLLLLFMLGATLHIHAQSNCAPEVYSSGQATYYLLLEQGRIGNCTFINDSVKPYYAALATGMYNGPGGSEPGKWCGACVEVTGQRGTEIVQIVDQCPTCENSFQDLDLSPQAFEAIVGPLSQGIGPLSWHEVPCPRFNKPIYVIIQGSNQWYGKVIVAGHNNRIGRVEIKNGTVWEDMERGEDNGWVKGNLGGLNSYDVRITDIFGEQVTVTGVDLRVGDGMVMGDSNFDPCVVASSTDFAAYQFIEQYPNPVEDRINFSGVSGISNIQILNAHGASVADKILSSSSDELSINTTDLTMGLYFVQFKKDGAVVHRSKFVKE